MRLFEQIVRNFKETPKEIKYVLLLFFFTRIMLTTFGVVLTDPNAVGTMYTPVHMFNIWGKWDTGFYVNIADNGYSAKLNSDGTANYGFFPLYPWLMRVVGFATQNSFAAGFVISNICLIASAVLLYRLMKFDYGEKDSLRAVKYLFFLPPNFLLSAVLAQSLFVFLVVASFYCARKEKWFWCGIAGMLAALTRPYGFIVAIPIAWEYLARYRKLKLNSVCVLLIPCGTLIFFTFCWWLTGDFLAYKHIKQSGWLIQPTNPVRELFCGIMYHGATFFNWHTAPQLIAITLFLVFWRRIRFSYWLFGMGLVLLQLSCTNTADGALRYYAELFPIAMILAIVSSKRRVDEAVTLVLAMLQVFLFIAWRINLGVII